MSVNIRRICNKKQTITSETISFPKIRTDRDVLQRKSQQLYKIYNSGIKRTAIGLHNMLKSLQNNVVIILRASTEDKNP